MGHSEWLTNQCDHLFGNLVVHLLEWYVYFLNWTPFVLTDIVQTWIKIPYSLEVKIWWFTINSTLLNTIDFSNWEAGHSVAEDGGVPPLEKDAKSTPEVGDGFTLQLPGVPGKCIAWYSTVQWEPLNVALAVLLLLCTHLARERWSCVSRTDWTLKDANASCLCTLVQWNSQTNKCSDYHGFKQRMGHLTRINRLDKSLLEPAHTQNLILDEIDPISDHNLISKCPSFISNLCWGPWGEYLHV